MAVHLACQALKSGLLAFWVWSFYTVIYMYYTLWRFILLVRPWNQVRWLSECEVSIQWSTCTISYGGSSCLSGLEIRFVSCLNVKFLYSYLHVLYLMVVHLACQALKSGSLAVWMWSFYTVIYMYYILWRFILLSGLEIRFVSFLNVKFLYSYLHVLYLMAVHLACQALKSGSLAFWMWSFYTVIYMYYILWRFILLVRPWNQVR